MKNKKFSLPSSAVYINQLTLFPEMGPTQTYSCKEQFLDTFGLHIRANNIDLRNPTIAYWTSPDAVHRSAENFQKVINDLEERLGLKRKTTCFIPRHQPHKHAYAFVIKPHPYWVRHPIHLSAFLITLCQSPSMVEGETFAGFAKRVAKLQATRDAIYYHRANTNGGMHCLMNGGLPAHDRGRMTTSQRWEKDYAYALGFASYKPKNGKVAF